MTIMGAVLAGGRSSRFGSDKALAVHRGKRLIDWAVAALQPACAEVVVIGREEPHYPCAPDTPAPDLGPLGGLAGALTEAARRGHGAIICCPVDIISLPPDLAALLTPGPAFLEGHPTIGSWPGSALAPLLHFIDTDPKRSLRGFAAHVGARAVHSPHVIANINRPGDLVALDDHPARPDAHSGALSDRDPT